MAKYDALHRHLRDHSGSTVRLTFDEIGRLVGGLPPSSSGRTWWANTENGRHVQADAWLSAGYKIESIDMDQRVVWFAALK